MRSFMNLLIRLVCGSEWSDKTKTKVSALCILLPLFFSAFWIINPRVRVTYHEGSIVGDAFIPPDVPRVHSSSVASMHSTPGYYETSEYLIGSVAVGVIFLESDGTIDVSTEDWIAEEESDVINEIKTGLDWWANQNPSAHVSFSYEIHYRVPTSYEPINRPAFPDQELWISEAMSYLGFSDAFFFEQVRDYVNDLRDRLDTDWAFTIFIIDSSNDPDGCFDGPQSGRYWFAYACLGGPFFVMTYDNDGWHIFNMDKVTAHETGHIFYATDEYNGAREYSGYLNVSDVEWSRGLMHQNALRLSAGTWGQVGWRDTDGDGIQDIVDTFPNVSFLVNMSDTLTDDILVTYNGSIAEEPYPNHNPFGTGKDLTINTIIGMQYRMDLGGWLEASATDGTFDETEENFCFTSSLLTGIHILTTRGRNSVGNEKTSCDSHAIGQISALTQIKIGADNWLTITVDKTTFNVVGTTPRVIRPMIKVSNIGYGYATNSIAVSYLIPEDWLLDLNVVRILIIRGTGAQISISKQYSFITFESNILAVSLLDLESAVGDSLRFGDSLVVSFKLEFTLQGSILPDIYAWSEFGPVYYFTYASDPVRSRLRWVLGPPWVWKRP